MWTAIWILAGLAILLALTYQRVSILISTIDIGAFLLIASVLANPNLAWLIILWGLYFIIVVPLNIPAWRRLISRLAMGYVKKAMPPLSDTERTVLKAGSVTWEGDILSGAPDWEKLHALPTPTLTHEEQAFLDGPVDQLCQMLDTWQISQSMEIPDKVWRYIKDHRFFGMIIPKEYGGLAFSAWAHSRVIAKIASVSTAVATAVAVPNSLGPAELLLHYGTQAQRDHYLSRLASGEEVPCFGLTSPVAGSDAGAIADYGIVCREVIEGKEQLGIKLNWRKRYITLAPIATVIGLAFKLHDPEHLLGTQESLGITCALIPVKTPGVSTGRRHYPLHSAFPNGPTEGKDVLIPLDWVIGGHDGIGDGWRMLMESLAIGRSITLPSLSNGVSKRVTLLTGTYARVRRQFNVAIGQFEGVQEKLATLAAASYLIEALTRFTVSAVDSGQKPAVASAIGKYHATEWGRMAMNAAMDVQGGKAICMGPHNYLAQFYLEQPISITVEGANILTRSLMIFGQGILRCHPYWLLELNAATDMTGEAAIQQFNQALWAHAGFILSNKSRAFVLGLTHGYLAGGAKQGPLKRYYQHFSRFAAALAFVGDMSVILLGGELKRKEFLSARLGDVLSDLYIGSAVLHYYHSQGESNDDLPVVRWICDYLLHHMQAQLDLVLHNFPNRWLGMAMRVVVFPLGKRFQAPKDKLTHQVANLVINPSQFRSQLNHSISDQGNGYSLQAMEQLLTDMIAAEALLRKLQSAIAAGKIKAIESEQQLAQAIEAQVLTQAEVQQLEKLLPRIMELINVDDFSR